MKGLIGLSQNVRNTESAMRGLSVLERMEGRMQQDKQNELLAQQQQEQLFERAYQMADQLLEKDRKRINKRIKMAQSQLQNNLRDAGGTKADFMAQGGLSLVNGIATDIMRSDEAVRYQENKMNLAKIFEIQEKGMGHRLSPKDLESVKAYERGEDGVKITYSGIMNEIDLPQQEYDYGYVVKPEEILDYKENYAKILQDYQTYKGYPASDDLGIQRKQLIGYVKERGYTSLGTNTTGLQLKAQAARSRATENTKGGPQNSSMSKFTYAMTAGDRISYKDLMEKYNGDVYGTLRETGNGSTNESINAYFNEKSSIVAKNNSLPGEKGVFETAWQFTGLAGAAGTYMMQKFKEKGIDPHAENYSLVGSYKILHGLEEDVASAVFGSNAERNGMTLNNFTPDSEMFTADGTILQNKNVTPEKLKGNYKIEGIVNGFIGKDQDGNPQLITQIVDKNGKPDEEKNKIIKEGNLGQYGEGDQLKSEALVVIRDQETGNVFYKPTNVSQETMQSVIRNQIGAKDNVTQMIKNDNYVVQTHEIAKQWSGAEKQLAQQTVENFNPKYTNNENFISEGEQFYGHGSAGTKNRNDMMKGFYQALNFVSMPPNQQGQKDYLYSSEKEPAAIENLIANKTFTEFARNANMFDMLSNYNDYENPYQLINEWLENMNAEANNESDKSANAEFANQWIRHTAMFTQK